MRLIDADELKEQFKDKEGDDFTAFHFYEAIDKMPTVEERKTEWIPVTERLPEEDGWYLVTKNIRGARFVMECWFALNGGWGSSDRDAITAWMPIQKPYQGE